MRAKWNKRHLWNKKSRGLALLLCMCIVVTMLNSMGLSATVTYALGNPEPTEHTIQRVADPDTTDAYLDNLLNNENGSRYAGRIWTDKTVFAYADGADNTIKLDMATDGIADGTTVGFNSDFAHVYSALASSQVVNEYPPSPIDLVIVFDMSGSMGQDTKYEIENKEGENGYNALPAANRTMAERIKNSRIQKTLDAINATIDSLMEQNPQNRVSVCAYGANATVLMPLAHYKKLEGSDSYLEVGGMETLKGLGDLQYDGGEGQYLWKVNRDTSYTVEVHAKKNEYTGVLNKGDAKDQWVKYDYTVSNNVNNDQIKANPGYAKPEPADYAKDSGATTKLSADEYIGYFTNTQGGIFLGYEQLAKTADTTYTEMLSNGVVSTVARIPAAIIMTDGGSNFAFNEMGTKQKWCERYGVMNGSNAKYHDNNLEDGGIDVTHRLLPPTDNGEKGNVGDEWYQVYLPSMEVTENRSITSLYNNDVGIREGALYGEPHWDNAGVLYGNDRQQKGAPGTILQVLMTASYMKSAVNQHYAKGWEKGGATADSQVPLSAYTMGVDSNHVPQWGRVRLYPTMDPAKYLFSQAEWEKENLFGENKKVDTGLNTAITIPKVKEILQSTAEQWEQWSKNSEITPQIEEADGGMRIRISPLQEGGYEDSRYQNVKVTNEDVVENIVYTDGFYDVESKDLGNIFDTILSLITGKVFTPITGSNDAGVSDSITYQDPIGEYMEVKNQSITATVHGESAPKSYDMALLHFGELHGLVRTGVYDYQWNVKYLNANSKKDDAMPMGWYRGEDPEGKVEFVPQNDGLPKDSGSTEEAWENGWVFRLDYKTLASYVSILKDVETRDKMTEQQKNTVYTVYRFAGDSEERNRLRINPIYGESVPEELQKQWAAAGEEAKSDDSLYRDYDGVYRLSDIRVWVEDTGDYNDSEGAITPESTGYEISLYMNIPTAAVPTQVAEITLGPSGVLSYETNLAEKNESTPIRLFYAVGLEESLITRDEDGEQTGVDISGISEEYQAAHRDEDNSIWFLSNYYSNTPYTGYTSDAEAERRTRGDPTVTFSPAENNRYYVFQKALPLYAHAYRVQADGTLKPVDRSDGDMSAWSDKTKGGNGSTAWENYGGTEQNPATWEGGLFMGVYQSAGDFTIRYNSRDTRNKTITDAHGQTYFMENADGVGNIVFLQEDLLDQIRSGAGGGYEAGSVSFDSNDYFFMVVDYYLPDTGATGVDKDGNQIAGSYGAHAVQRVVARKGSEFGSGIEAADIGNGDMLCWTDINKSVTLNLKYNSRSDSGDSTRGEPMYEKLFTDDKGALKAYLSGIGIKDDSLEAEADYWLGVQKTSGLKEWIDSVKAEHPDETEKWKKAFADTFQWAVAAKPGGLRVGDLFQSRMPKTANTTDTAYSVYIPTVSASSGTGGETVFDTYLGNNGKLSVANEELLVTKTLVPPRGFEMREEQENKDFNYQVYIQGFTGERNATKVFFNPYSESWQRRIASIDILTDNGDLLLDSSGQKAMFERSREADGEDEMGNPTYTARQVVAGSDGSYYYAKEDGTASAERRASGKEGLFYLYLPPNVGVEGETAESSGEWARRIYEDSIAIENSGRTTYYKKGTADPTPEDAGTNDTYREENAARPAGTRSYWALDAELIPISEVESVLDEWSHVPGIGHAHLSYFTLVINRPTEDVSANDIISPFKTRTMYVTEPLTFGIDQGDLYDTSTDWDGFPRGGLAAVARNTATFTLKSGEGLLFNGIANARTYRLTENISAEDAAKGYILDQILQIMGETEQQTYMPEDFGVKRMSAITFLSDRINALQQQEKGDKVEGEKPSESTETKKQAESQELQADIIDILRGAVPDRQLYSVSGDTGIFEEQVHFTNTYEPGSISVTKELAAGEGTMLNDTDRSALFDFALSLTTSDLIGPTPLEGAFYYTITEQEEEPDGKVTEKTVKEGRMLAKAAKVPEDTDLVSDGKGTWSFQLKGGQTMKVDNLPAGTGYAYTVAETQADGYQTESVPAGSASGAPKNEYTASGTVLSGNLEAVKVRFTNTKKTPEPAEAMLELAKEVTDNSAEKNYELKAEDFSFLVTPSAANPADDPIARQAGWDETAGRLTVKNAAPAEDVASAKAVLFPEHTQFGTAGVYEYTVREVIPNPTAPGISYDSKSYQVKVTVTEDYGEGETPAYTGKLNAAVEVAGVPDGTLTFQNGYNPNEINIPLQAHKTLLDQNGKNLPVGEGDYTFEIKGISAEETISPEAGTGKESTESTEETTGATESTETTETKPETNESTETKPETTETTESTETKPETTETTESKPETTESTEPKPGETEATENTGTKPGETKAPESTETKPESTGATKATETAKALGTKAAAIPDATVRLAGRIVKNQTIRVTSAAIPSGKEAAKNGTPGALEPTETATGETESTGTKPGTTETTETMESTETGNGTTESTETTETTESTETGTETTETTESTEATTETTEATESTEAGTETTESTESIEATTETIEATESTEATTETTETTESTEATTETTEATESTEAGTETTETTESTEATTETTETTESTEATTETTETTESTEAVTETTESAEAVTETTGTEALEAETQPGKQEGEDPTAIPMPKGSNTAVTAADGYANFGTICFKSTGVYVYEITEKKEDRVGISYDERTYKATVTVARDEATGALYASVSYSDGTAETPTAEFVNSMETGGLQVKKTVTGTAGEKWKEFRFTVTMTGADGNVLDYIDGAYGGMTFRKGIAEFTLKDGDSLAADSLPAGAHYKVEEEDYSNEGYAATYTGATGVDKIPAGSRAEVTVENHKDKKTGSLSISKTVTGAAGDKTKEFHFSVLFETEEDLSGTVVTKNGEEAPDLAVKDGVLAFTLHDGETVEVSGLPAGTKYTATEQEADQDGYKTSAPGAAGAIPEGESVKTQFENNKPEEIPEPKYGNLTVTKTVTGSSGDVNKEFHFTVELSDKNIGGIYGGMAFQDGVATFTLKHGESVSAEGLPAGVTYTVTEQEANRDSYKTTSEGAAGAIPENGTASAAFVNEKRDTHQDEKPRTGSLTVKKTVKGDGGDVNKEFHFQIELSDKGINGKYGDITFQDGVAEISLKHGESKTAENLPEKVTYQVTEEEENEGGYQTTHTDASGTIIAGEERTAAFVNEKQNEKTESKPEGPQKENLPAPGQPEGPQQGNPPASEQPERKAVEETAPKTGDETHWWLWTAAFAASLAGMGAAAAGYFHYRRKRRGSR